jgi:hypothetical protein
MLKFCTVDLDDSVRIAEKHLRCSLYNSSLPGTGWTKKQHCADRTVGRLHSRKKNLIKTAQAAYCAFLPDDPRGQLILEFYRSRTFLRWVKSDL